MSATVRSPFTLACTENLPLTKQAVWIDCQLVPGETYRLRSLIEGTPSTADKAALVCFETTDRNAEGGTGLSMSASVGPYMYLRSGAGLHQTDRVFSVASPARRFGLMAWGNRGQAKIRTLTIEKVDGVSRPTEFFFSFDVEAAAERAAGDPIDSLVWGKIGGQEYGIRRICDVLEQYRLKGNFLVDFATCSFEGDAALGRIVEFLASRGHEIHMHLHPEWLAQYWGLRIRSGKSPYGGAGGIHLDSTPYEMSRRLLDFTMSKYEQFVGQTPRLFRSGAYRMNPQLVLAAGSLGIEALSNARGETIGDPTIGGDPAAYLEPFLWENGVLEIPVDVSSPEASKWENYLGKYEAAVSRKSVERTFNIVMHSWSLTRRNAQGIHDAFAPEYDEKFHQMCEHAAQHGVARGYSEYIDSRRLPRPTMRIARIRTGEPERLVYEPSEDIATCNVCDAVFGRGRMESDSCPGCGAGTRHRQLKHVLDTYGNVFDGRSVVAFRATPAERRAFLTRASGVLDLDPRREFGMRLGVADLAEIEQESYDCFFGLHVLNRMSDDAGAVAEVARILKPKGVFVSTVSYRSEDAAEPDDVTDFDGSIATERDRSYSLAEYLNLLSKEFTVSMLPGIDPVTDKSARVFFAYKN